MVNSCHGEQCDVVTSNNNANYFKKHTSMHTSTVWNRHTTRSPPSNSYIHKLLHCWNQSGLIVAKGVCLSVQDKQVTWAQHGHTQCMRINTHLLGDLGHTPAMKILHSEVASEAVFGHKYNSSDLPVCSLHVRMKLAIAHAKLIFDLHYFYPGTSEFNVGTGPGMPGCSYMYATAVSYRSYFTI